MPRLSKIGAACLAAFGYTQGTSTITANYLVVAAGGGGGYNGGGGGGAGGLLLGIANLNFTLSYVVTVGAGGIGSNGATSNNGTNGSNSSFDTFSTAIGGGKGGDLLTTGFTGGSGGGGGSGYNNTAPGSGAAGTSGQGNAGGSGRTLTIASPPLISGGGGGGASATGGAGGNGFGGTGGAGTASSITGSSVTYAGGGAGGGGTSVTAGGAGGGGAGGGGSTAAVAGSTNTGGGGGGGGNPATTGGNGGSGVVIISYTSPTQLFGGGIVTYSGGNWIHTFRTSGTLVPVSTFTATALIVAGGGGGGNLGGGGAGGLQSITSQFLDVNSNYIITVGAGGAGSTTIGVSGSNSSFSVYSTASVGGGYGAGNASKNGGNGGSGGGAGGDGGVNGTAGSPTSGQGNSGGNANSNGGGTQFAGGGGGGASAVGSNAPATNTGGAGGSGTASSISGTSVTYAGGGGGGAYVLSGTGVAGAGGSGGGGTGGVNGTAGTSGTANRGSGGGAGGFTSAGNPQTGAAGGSGVVIISYAGAQRMAGGTVTFVGGNTIHTFTSSGYLSALKLVNNSLRFKASTTSYLNRTFGTPTSRRIFTFNTWFKRGQLGAYQPLFINNDSGTLANRDGIRIGTDDKLEIYLNNLTYDLITTQVFRDTSAWYMLTVAIDTTQATAANRIKVYVNGAQVTAFGTSNYPFQNYDCNLNTAVAHYIGVNGNYAAVYLDGYMTEINFVDGQALTPSSFGGYNSFGVWQPTQYLGSFGNNGFYLPFTNNASSTTIGYDFSPNQNNWASTGFTLTPTTSVAYDSMTDVPTLTSATASNWCVANPLDAATGLTINDGNLKLAASAAGSKFVRSSIALPSSGAFYAELTFANASSASIGETIGICTASRSLTAANNATGAYLFYASALGALISNGTTLASSLTAIAANELFQVAIDVTNSKMWIGRTNVWYNSTGGTTGNPSTGANPTFTGAFVDYFIYAGFDTASAVTANINFGQRPFVGTVPTGFVALNAFNM